MINLAIEKDSLYRLALSRIPGLGPVGAKKLIGYFGGAKEIFQADKPALLQVCAKQANAILNFDGFQELEKELAFLERQAIRMLFITDNDYPRRLLSYDYAPILLFYQGNQDLNASKIISVIGTRRPTAYGRLAAEGFIKELSALSPGMLIISGLAYGIDAIAHQAALDNQLPTVGILGHGLDRIYPQQHTGLAQKMVKQGGLLTAYKIDTEPETYHFPLRNKLVAGICDALVVVETGSRGGSMLTVTDALKFKRKIFAFPGRINDPKSAGCNMLIQKGKASLLTSAQQLMEDMKWLPPAIPPVPQQTSLFPPAAEAGNTALSEKEKAILALLQEKENCSLDFLAIATHQDMGELAMTLLTLELQERICSFPGKRYALPRLIPSHPQTKFS